MLLRSLRLGLACRRGFIYLFIIFFSQVYVLPDIRIRCLFGLCPSGMWLSFAPEVFISVTLSLAVEKI